MWYCFSGYAVEDALGIAWMFKNGGKFVVENIQSHLWEKCEFAEETLKENHHSHFKCYYSKTVLSRAKYFSWNQLGL